MVKCPNCEKEINEPKKSWTYGVFRVKAYSCNCGSDFREYVNIHVIEGATSGDKPKLEKHSFQLMLKKGRWVKA